MKLSNHKGRATLLRDGEAFDVAKASEGCFHSNPHRVFAKWDEFRRWERELDCVEKRARVEIEPRHIGPPSPHPSQIFGIGLNYADHAKEASLASIFRETRVLGVCRYAKVPVLQGIMGLL
jgi:2-keto-4-pentenoate hydratase/2-oxohepta-3-ene-1,7-dioic acid hydratase in catechol pathway